MLTFKHKLIESKIMYQINRLLNNTTSTNMFNAAVNSNGSRIVVTDTHLPDLSTGALVSQTGSFKVYDVKYDSEGHVSCMSQVGQTVIGEADESLGMGVGISGDGSLVLATSNVEVFKVYKYNRATSNWDVIFSAGATSVLDGPISIMGIRYDLDFKIIMTANVSPTGDTRFVYHVKQSNEGAVTWVCPEFSTDPVILERFSRIRGLWMSDCIINNECIVVNLQATNPETSAIRILVTKFNEDSFSDYGSITEFASDVDTNEYRGISVTVNRKGTHIGVSYYKENKVHLKIYAVDVDLNWNMVKQFSFALDTPNSERSSQVIFDDSLVGASLNSIAIPGKMMIAVANGFSSDKLYGIYTNSCHPVTGEYSTSRDVSFGERLDSLTGNVFELISFGGTVSKNFKTVLAAFAGPAVVGVPYGPAHGTSFPVERISNVGDFNSDGISIALLVKECSSSSAPECHASCEGSVDCGDHENTTVTIKTSKKITLTLSTS